VALENSNANANDQSRAGLSQLERTAIFDLNPFATVIYDRSIDQILAVNQAFVQLTNFSSILVAGQSLSSILPGEQDTNPIYTNPRLVSLNQFMGEPLQVSLTIQGFDPTNQRVALLFQTSLPSLDMKKDLIDQEVFFDNYAQITKIGKQPDLQSVFAYVTNLAKKVTQAEDINIYLVNEADDRLHRVTINANEVDHFLPSYLTLEDLTNLETPILWKENKKTISELHRLAQQAGFKYLATIPLSKEGEWSGLITLAGHQPLPNDESLRFLSLLGMETSAVLEHFLTIENARQKVQKIRQVIQIEQAVIDNLEEGVIILTPDLRIAEMNPAAEIILGYASKEVFRQPIDAILIGTETLTSAFNTALQGISTLVSSDLRLHNRTGKSFPAQILTVPVKADDRLVSIIILLRDLSQTEQIRARTQQLEQRAFLGEVTAVFAHEVKNPINSLMTGLQFIGMNLEENSPHAELVSRLQNDCLRLTHLMDSVLTFSKPVEYHLSPVDLSLLIPRILERWGPRLRRLNIDTYFETCVAHPQINGDARALEQVFVNLISNAVQAMDTKGGSLSIKVMEPHDTVDLQNYEIIVADSGPGIPDDIKEHIFEPFITTNPNGTGLGLAISKRIVTAHKGIINVESFPGGTMFHVLLPKSTGD